MEICLQCDVVPDKPGRLFRADHGVLIGAAACGDADIRLADVEGDEVVFALLPAPDGWELVPGPGARGLRLNGRETDRTRVRAGDTVTLSGSAAAVRIKAATEPLLEEVPTALLMLNSRTARIDLAPFVPAVLEAVAGPAAGGVFPLPGDKADIGSAAGQDVCLPDPLVSPRHARVVRDDQGWRVVDLESRYGTFVNRELITTAPLRHGDALQTGATVFRFSLTEAAARETRMSRSAASPVDGERDQEVFLLPRVIAHEIKNYLAVLDQSARELRESAPAGAGMTANIQRVQLVREQIGELIPMLRVSSMDLKLEPADLSQLVCEQLALLERLLHRSGVDARLELPGKAIVVCDRLRLAHVIMNLIKNAVEAMPDGGTLTAGIRAGKEGVTFSIKDTGQGMAPAVAARAFEPLFTTKEGGSGLGLYLVKDLVERHQGRITFETTPGQGTEFKVWLPRRGYRL